MRELRRRKGCRPRRLGPAEQGSGELRLRLSAVEKLAASVVGKQRTQAGLLGGDEKHGLVSSWRSWARVGDGSRRRWVAEHEQGRTARGPGHAELMAFLEWSDDGLSATQLRSSRSGLSIEKRSMGA
jgi:hypothetical protein